MSSSRRWKEVDYSQATFIYSQGSKIYSYQKDCSKNVDTLTNCATLAVMVINKYKLQILFRDILVVSAWQQKR